MATSTISKPIVKTAVTVTPNSAKVNSLNIMTSAKFGNLVVLSGYGDLKNAVTQSYQTIKIATISVPAIASAQSYCSTNDGKALILHADGSDLSIKNYEVVNFNQAFHFHVVYIAN